MNINKVTLYEVVLPLKVPFRTHRGLLKERPVIIVEIEDIEGTTGYGEVTAFPTPFYTAETINTGWHMIKDVIIPSLSFEMLNEPSDFPEQVAFIQGNQMAKAGFEGALWDVYAKQRGLSLSKLIGGVREEVEAGAVLSLTNQITRDVNKLLSEGYKRFKLKVEKGKEEEMIASVKDVYPDLPIMFDANGMYDVHDIERIKSFDSLGLLMIEQPFRAGDFYLHQQLQDRMDTPICLDESVQSFDDAVQAITLKSCQVINIKISRVGGLTEAIKIHDYCKSHNIPVWCGGMVETGISKAHNIALSSLPDFVYPGDLSSSTRYFDKDVIEPFIEVQHGGITVPTSNGIGFSLNKEYLDQLMGKKYEYHL
ncbi:o-succinylbenzoate synthase [Halobacillus seohaensis]|uniref:o-succinylbenzoate synthase n=1 Tax=Halobacillus seohaensis TaxID=447421 RepID=A0ABW2ENR4_9BACI